MIENQAHVVSDIDGKFGGGFGEPFQAGIIAFQDVDIRPKCRRGSEDFDDCLLTRTKDRADDVGKVQRYGHRSTSSTKASCRRP